MIKQFSPIFSFMGGTTLLSRCIEYCTDKNIHINSVISPDSEVHEVCVGQGIDSFWSISHEAKTKIGECDYLFSIVNYNIVPKDVLAAPRKAAINYHDGPLPRYAGIHATSWAIINGEKQHGVTWHQMVETIDAGDIYKQKIFDIADNDTAYILNMKAYDNAFSLFEELVEDILQERLTGYKQNLANRSYYSLGSALPDGGFLDFSRRSIDLYRLFRGAQIGKRHMNSLGTVKVLTGNAVFTVESLRIIESGAKATPGLVRDYGQDRAVVECGDGAISLGGLSSWPGENAKDFLAALSDTDKDESGRPLITKDISGFAEKVKYAARHEAFWIRTLAKAIPLVSPLTSMQKVSANVTASYKLSVPGVTSEQLVCVLCEWLRRVTPQENEAGAIAASTPELQADRPLSGLAIINAPSLKESGENLISGSETIAQSLSLIEKEAGFLKDVFMRYPALEMSVQEVCFTKGLTRETVLSLVEQGPHSLILAILNDGSVELFARVPADYNESFDHLGRSFDVMLKDGLENPNKPLNELAVLSKKDKNYIVKKLNGSVRPDYDLETSVLRLFKDCATKHPESPALYFHDEEITYGEFSRRVESAALKLIARGIGEDDVVALFTERSIEMLVGVWASMLAGASFMPIDVMAPADRIETLLSQSGSELILTHSPLVQKLEIGAQAKILNLDDIERTLPEGADPSVLDYDIDAGSNAYVLFTSGTTGVPKGVEIPHRGLINRLLWMSEAMALTGEDKFLQKTPYTFDVSVWELTLPFILGAPLYILEPEFHKDPISVRDSIEENGVTICHFVPTMFDIFLEAQEDGEPRRAPSSLKHVVLSGEALPDSSRRRFYRLFPSSTLHNLYGPAEASIDVTHFICGKEDSEKQMFIGKTVANTSLYILDKQMRPLPVGSVGEIYIGGVQVGRGYVNQPELTNERFLPDPFFEGVMYRTGDYARFHSNGLIEYLGRVDMQIKLRGVRIEVQEIEKLLRTHRDVKLAVVTVEGKRQDAFLVAFITPETVSSQELRNHLMHYLPPVMIPARIIPVASFPLNPSGKLDMKALKAVMRKRPLPSISDEPFEVPKNDTEKSIREHLAKLLKVDEETLSASASIKSMGVDSLILIRLHGAMKKTGVVLDIPSLAQAESIRDIADRAIVAETGSDESHISAGEFTRLLNDMVQDDDELIVIHSSFPSLGLPEETIKRGTLDAIEAWLSRGKTVVVAAFNFEFPRTGRYHHIGSRPETGVLAELFSERVASARRTPHVMYSWMTAGPQRDRIIATTGLSAFGEDSSFTAFETYRTRYLLIGTDVFTHTHRWEQDVSIPYRYIKRFPGVADFGSGEHPIYFDMYVRDLDLDPKIEASGLIQNFLKVESLKPLISTKSVGKGRIHSLSADELGEGVRKLLKQEPCGLLSNGEEIQSIVEEESAYWSFKDLEVPELPGVSVNIANYCQTVENAEERAYVEAIGRNMLVSRTLDLVLNHDAEGRPIFNSEISGSISHTLGQICLAHASNDLYVSIGVDLETAEPDPNGLWPKSDSEALLFAQGEALFKCLSATPEYYTTETDEAPFKTGHVFFNLNGGRFVCAVCAIPD